MEDIFKTLHEISHSLHGAETVPQTIKVNTEWAIFQVVLH